MNPLNFTKLLIEIYENDVCCGMTEEKNFEQIRMVISETIINLTKIIHNWRYCTNLNCPCWPESHLKKMIVHYDEIYKEVMYPPMYEEFKQYIESLGEKE